MGIAEIANHSQSKWETGLPGETPTRTGEDIEKTLPTREF